MNELPLAGGGGGGGGENKNLGDNFAGGISHECNFQ